MVPEWFRRVIEFPEIMKAWAYALNQVDGNIKKLWDNQYIQTCDEETLSQYERLLGIIPSGSDTLEYRRSIVLNKFSMIVPFSEGFLRSRLDEMYGADGYTFEVSSEDLTATLSITSWVPRGLEIFFDLWYGVAPAHIAITATEDFFSEVGCETEHFGAVFTSSVFHDI